MLWKFQEIRRRQLGCLVGLILAGSGLARAEVFSFTDSDGVVHFTDVPTDTRFQKVREEGQRSERRKAAPQAARATALPPTTSIFDDHIQEASERFNIPESLIRAVMAVESNFNPKAVSNAGAEGLMQLMPPTAAEMGVLDSFDPRQNVLGGTRYLRTLANAFDGDLVLTLAAYNAGHQAVTRHMDIPPYRETQQYVRRVLRLYYFFKKQARQQAVRASSGGRTR